MANATGKLWKMQRERGNLDLKNWFSSKEDLKLEGKDNKVAGRIGIARVIIDWDGRVIGQTFPWRNGNNWETLNGGQQPGTIYLTSWQVHSHEIHLTRRYDKRMELAGVGRIVTYQPSPAHFRCKKKPTRAQCCQLIRCRPRSFFISTDFT